MGLYTNKHNWGAPSCTIPVSFLFDSNHHDMGWFTALRTLLGISWNILEGLEDPKTYALNGPKLDFGSKAMSQYTIHTLVHRCYIVSTQPLASEQN